MDNYETYTKRFLGFAKVKKIKTAQFIAGANGVSTGSSIAIQLIANPIGKKPPSQKHMS